jgi:hypothetical protein
VETPLTRRAAESREGATAARLAATKLLTEMQRTSRPATVNPPGSAQFHTPRSIMASWRGLAAK